MANADRNSSHPAGHRHSLHLIRINDRHFRGWDHGRLIHDRGRTVSTATAAEVQSSTGSEVPPEADAPVQAEPIYFSPVLAGFDWSSEWDLGNGVMDQTHHEFVELLDGLIRASDEDFLARLDEFARHTEDHFEREQRDMEDMHFPPQHCHQAQHENVLAAVRDVRERVAGGDIIIGRYLAERIAEWFPEHADFMDRALARWIDYMQQGGAELRASGVPDLGCESACGSGESHAEGHACGSDGHACSSEGHACSADDKSGCGSGSACDCG
jgi:hemerythrin